ncbi:MAG: ribonuclease Z, ribonuclease Z [archaeon GW2011_AR9]|nr:MAG: ribonuclease Z, ribonuclease Z [archaeon GW2011_AR9]MBS3120352.1 ribonuclease Z [Candidatus Woesearchaeota archaeon]HIH13180.1 ribonuclease Z [Candidatus Woesearchaeota archaeon]
MIDILFLGTGCMQPTKTRNHSGILLSSKKENILLDCGEGIQRQMRIAGIKPAKITRLLISHWHGDHVFGIPGLMSSMGADKPGTKLYIYGPIGTAKYLEHLFQSFAAKDIIEHEVKEVKSGIFFESEEFQLEARPLKHSVPCVGYSYIEKDRVRIDEAKAQKLGLQGPILGKLQQGEDVTFQGKKIKAKEVTYITVGKKVSYVADTVPCEGAEQLAANADLLISEGTHLDDIKEKTAKFMHLTVKQAALIASENNAKKLVITHISQRYKSNAEIVEEARTHFDNSIVAEDFMKVSV